MWTHAVVIPQSDGGFKIELFQEGFAFPAGVIQVSPKAVRKAGRHGQTPDSYADQVAREALEYWRRDAAAKEALRARLRVIR